VAALRNGIGVFEVARNMGTFGACYASPGIKPQDAPGENVDEAFREIDELCERWNNRLAVENLSLSERYLKGKIEFGVILEWQPDSRINKKYVAVFERKFSVSGRASQHRSHGHRPSGLIRNMVLYSEHLVRCGYRDEQLMFVGDIQTVETPSGIVPSTVRLQSANEFYRICGRSVDALDTAAFKVSSIRTYWERSVVTGRTAVRPHELPRSFHCPFLQRLLSHISPCINPVR
jgi:hypothetical protein